MNRKRRLPSHGTHGSSPGLKSPERVVEFASSVCRPEAEALFCSCTAWRSVEAVEALEQRLGKPVVSSNQAMIWAAFRKLGIREPIQGFGSLLASLATTAVSA